jgi:hypothetical protein
VPPKKRDLIQGREDNQGEDRSAASVVRDSNGHSWGGVLEPDEEEASAECTQLGKMKIYAGKYIPEMSANLGEPAIAMSLVGAFFTCFLLPPH